MGIGYGLGVAQQPIFALLVAVGCTFDSSATRGLTFEGMYAHAMSGWEATEHHAVIHHVLAKIIRDLVVCARSLS